MRQTLAVLLLLLTSCGDRITFPPTQPSNQTTVVIVNVGGASPAPGASPGTGTNPGSCVRDAIDSVRVGPFGIDCPAGTTAPRNGEGIIPFGCTATFTATPKDRTGTDVPSTLHGNQINWAVPVGGDKVDVTDWADGHQPFNKSVRPRAGSTPGDVQITATVCGVMGGWTGRTVAAGASSLGGLEGVGADEFVTRLH